jgi:hypothetical protein
MQGVPWGAPATHFGGGGGQGGGVFPGRQLQMVPAAAPGGQAPAGLDPVGHLSGGVPGGHGGGGIIGSRGGSGTFGMLLVSTTATSRTLISRV